MPLQAQVFVRSFKQPTLWRLINVGANKESDPEEMVLYIQGVLCAKDLPPITNKPRQVDQRTNNQTGH